MAISIPESVVVFDYGEVISRTPTDTDTDALLAVAGCDAEPFWQSYWAHREGLDRGTLSVIDYWQLVAADVGAAWSVSKVHELWVADFCGWFTPETRTIDLVDELRQGGTRLAILSNAGFDFGDPFRRSPMGSLFERVFVSAELNLVKPDPAIYRVAAEGLGIPLDRMVFIDNKLENVEAATALGIRAHHFITVEDLDAFLRSLEV